MRNQKQAMRIYAIVATILMAVAFVMREIYEDGRSSAVRQMLGKLPAESCACWLPAAVLHALESEN